MWTVVEEVDATATSGVGFAGGIEEVLKGGSPSMLGRGELFSSLWELAIDLAGDAIR